MSSACTPYSIASTSSPVIIERFEKCPCCDSKELGTIWHNPTPKTLKDWKDFMFGGRRFFDRVMGCNSCNFRYLEPIILGDTYYRTADHSCYHSLSEARLRYFSEIKTEIHKRGHHFTANAEILDIGAGEGDWLSIWSEIKLRYATEILSDFVDRMKEKGISLLSTLDKTNEQFDMISAFDFLEHVENPDHFLQKISTKLKDNGILIIGVPDMGKFLARLFGTRYYLYCPMHYSYFTQHSLRLLLSKYFKNVEIFASPPMYCTLNTVAKWIFPQLQSPMLNNLWLPFGYSASLIAIAEDAL